MKKAKLSFRLQLVRGAIGKKMVIKHYRYGVVRTKFPDMKGIKPSIQQQECRNSFREAVAFAKYVYMHPAIKLRWQKKLRKKARLFGALVREFMIIEKRGRAAARELGNRLINNCFKGYKVLPELGMAMNFSFLFNSTVPVSTESENEKTQALVCGASNNSSIRLRHPMHIDSTG